MDVDEHRGSDNGSGVKATKQAGENNQEKFGERVQVREIFPPGRRRRLNIQGQPESYVKGQSRNLDWKTRETEVGVGAERKLHCIWTNRRQTSKPHREKQSRKEQRVLAGSCRAREAETTPHCHERLPVLSSITARGRRKVYCGQGPIVAKGTLKTSQTPDNPKQLEANT